ncbi:hypothetical protein KIN20_010163 [Parelaphostrongylus tenuis]|uniref:Uncharacterized protein n=1 Tax=Parelaphostrongylus tenuis TaxID=148309 RepID=A0AAD5MSW7_PARTN|nr:hypothetical protein KIN20_010163 [Parelaphostrongylus tenuis]
MNLVHVSKPPWTAFATERKIAECFMSDTWLRKVKQSQIMMGVEFQFETFAFSFLPEEKSGLVQTMIT